MRFSSLFFGILKLPLVNELYWIIYKRKVIKSIKQGLVGFSLEGNNVCNYACIMCPYKKMTRPKEVMSLELFEKILNDAKEVGITAVNLSVYNDPFLDPLLFKRLELANKMGVETSFYSNASKMSIENINKLLVNPPNKIYFSVDANEPETYKKIRVNGNLDITKTNILNLIAKRKELGLLKPRICVTFSTQKLNQNELPEFKRFWKDRVDEILVSIVDDRNDNLVELSRSVDKSAKFVFPCIRMFKSVQVLSSGKVALCCMDYDGKHVFGDLKKQSIKEAFNSDVFKSFAKLHMNREGNKIPICSNCHELYRCSSYLWWKNE